MSFFFNFHDDVGSFCDSAMKRIIMITRLIILFILFIMFIMFIHFFSVN